MLAENSWSYRLAHCARQLLDIRRSWSRVWLVSKAKIASFNDSECVNSVLHPREKSVSMLCPHSYQGMKGAWYWQPPQLGAIDSGNEIRCTRSRSSKEFSAGMSTHRRKYSIVFR